ncbi:hypothetical protein CAEBREN_13331 [Caenorhabditis brenneri]|uniref:Uncharacterized protein n=1 Tax=Caenorhabditis brenneri TaxID=135651 RepID=G0N1J9_CAEBE|nr:hypothetical protein CAEBREN_13331 [Caenorhabditis brenneri]
MPETLQDLPQLPLEKIMKKWIWLKSSILLCHLYISKEVQIARSRSVFTVKCGSDFEENLKLLNDNGGNQRWPNWKIFKTGFVLEDFFSISDERNNIEVQDLQNIHDDGCLVSFF